jgi:hypothetical protein
MFATCSYAMMKSIISQASSIMEIRSNIMDSIRTNNQELERELKPHDANTQKHLKNPMARHYGVLVGQSEIIQAVRQPSNLASESLR